MLPRDPSDEIPLSCGGKAHAWRLLAHVLGEPQRAVADCCGVTATLIAGGWAIDPQPAD